MVGIGGVDLAALRVVDARSDAGWVYGSSIVGLAAVISDLHSEFRFGGKEEADLDFARFIRRVGVLARVYDELCDEDSEHAGEVGRYHLPLDVGADLLAPRADAKALLDDLCQTENIACDVDGTLRTGLVKLVENWVYSTDG